MNQTYIKIRNSTGQQGSKMRLCDTLIRMRSLNYKWCRTFKDTSVFPEVTQFKMQCKDYARNAHIDTLRKKGIWRISGILQQTNLTQNVIVMEQD